MTLSEVIERLSLAQGAIRQIYQFVGEVDKAMVAADETFEPFLSAERIATLKELTDEITEYSGQCVEALAVAAPKKAKKAK